MKPKNTKQEKVAVIKDLKTKLLVMGVAVIGTLLISGCQEQTAIEARSLKTQVFAKELTLKPITAQLASKVASFENSQQEKTDQKRFDLPLNIPNNLLQYDDASLQRLNLNTESWKATYDGKGLPLFRISF